MKLVRFFMVIVFLLTPSAQAASPWKEKPTYGSRATEKLDYGMKNLLGGWTVFFTEPYNYHQENKNLFAGIGMGLLKGIVYTVGGALHTVTFPVTALDIPLPGGGVEL